MHLTMAESSENVCRPWLQVVAGVRGVYNTWMIYLMCVSPYVINTYSKATICHTASWKVSHPGSQYLLTSDPRQTDPSPAYDAGCDRETKSGILRSCRIPCVCTQAGGGEGQSNRYSAGWSKHQWGHIPGWPILWLAFSRLVLRSHCGPHGYTRNVHVHELTTKFRV